MTNTPQMIHGQVEMVSVEWLMKNFTHSADYYYNDDGLEIARLIRMKGSDDHFGSLLHTIDTVGFRVPIVADMAYNGSNTLTLGNGHHRFAAAILLVLDAIPVYWAQGDYMSSHRSDTEELICDEGIFEGASDFIWETC